MGFDFYNKNNFYTIFLLVTSLVLAIDFIWIGLVMKQEYSSMIQTIQGNSLAVRILPTILSYLTIILSIVLFTIPNVYDSSRLFDCLFYGGVLGALMYGMFSFTNYALINDWTLRVVLLDTIWGFILYFLVSYIASLIIDKYVTIF